MSNPCLEDFKLQNHPNQIEETQTGEKSSLKLFHFQDFCFLFIDNQHSIAQRFQNLGMHDFWKTGNSFLEWILYRPSFLRLQHGNWYDEFWMGNGVLGLLWEDGQNKKSSLLSSVKKKEVNHRSYSSCIANLNKVRSARNRARSAPNRARRARYKTTKQKVKKNAHRIPKVWQKNWRAPKVNVQDLATVIST